MNMKISGETRLKRTQDMLESDVAGDVIALDVENGQCYGFNSVASEIWRLLEHHVSVSEICDSLVKQFEVDRTGCETDVILFLDDLCSEGLVKLAD
jgi:hypothetical protein